MRSLSWGCPLLLICTVHGDQSRLSATVSNDNYRTYIVDKCHYNVTMPAVYAVFASHQVEWNSMGKHMPWWSVLTGLPKTADVSEHTKAEFYESGVQHVTGIARSAHLNDKMVLDFGCGLGRLAFAFANTFNSRVTCVDQSVHHLSIAQAEWARRKTSGTVEFVVSGPDLLSSMTLKQFDFVHSVIVLQHMVPALQTVYLEQMCDLLAPGGKGWIQIPHKTEDPGCDLDESVRNGGMQMHSTPIYAIKNLFRRRGCRARVEDVGNAFVGGTGVSLASAIVTITKLQSVPSTRGRGRHLS